MEPTNAFIQHPAEPTPAELASALGPALPLWNALLATLTSQLPITSQEWNSSGLKYGWALRLQHKKRNLLYLGPCNGCFRAALVLGDKAMAATKTAGLPPSIRKALAEAKRYPEGFALRILVKTETDLPTILALTRIKLEN